MLTRQRIVSYGIPAAAAATIVAAALLTTRKDAPSITTPPPSEGNAIDVVFAVDTTGSMGGLLDGAKRTVWSIATHIKKTDPNANIRIGLVAYRDLGDAYVTRPFALTSDLDAAFAELSTYRAEGGGDTPEDVDAALADALKMQWRDDAKKLVFVVGDAPPASRGEVPHYADLTRDLASAGITVNAIRCGYDASTQTAFETIASLGNGEFSTIQQDGGVQQVATPYDDRMAALSAEYDGTAMIVGDAGVRGRYEAKMKAAAEAPAAAKADRAGYYAKGAGMKRADEDLVGSYATGGAGALDKVDQASLPDDMKNKDPEQIKAELERRVEKRQKIQAELKTLSKQREQYLEEKQTEGGGGFDAKVKDIVEKQLK